MEKTKYPDLVSHGAEHEEMLRQVEQYAAGNRNRLVPLIGDCRGISRYLSGAHERDRPEILRSIERKRHLVV